MTVKIFWIYSTAILAGLLLSIGMEDFADFKSYIAFSVVVTFSIHYLAYMWKALLPLSHEPFACRAEKIAALSDGLKTIGFAHILLLVILCGLAIVGWAYSLMFMLLAVTEVVDTANFTTVQVWSAYYGLFLAIYPIFGVYALVRYLYYRKEVKSHRKWIGESA